MSELELTGEAISRQLRRLENAPILCVASILCAVPAVFMAVLMYLDRPFGRSGGGVEVCVLVVGVVAIVGWIVGAANFHRFCLGKAGWIAPLVKYHVYAFATVAVVVALFVVWQILARAMFGPLSSPAMPTAYYVSTVVLTAGIIAAVRWLLPRLHRRFRADMLFLRREVTIAIAHDQIRKQMLRGRR